MTIGEGIAQGATKAYDRMESARQFNASLAEKRRAADMQAFVALANSPRTRTDNSSAELAERQRQFDEGMKFKREMAVQEQNQFDSVHAWDEALKQQAYNANELSQKETAARLAHYQELEAQSRQKAADLNSARHTAIKDLFWMARNNGGYLTSPELLSEFTKRFEAPDLAGITTAGFFYNEDGTVKTPDNDDNRPAVFGVSYNYVDPQTGKVAIDQNGQRAERVLVPKFQSEWIAEGQFPSEKNEAARVRGENALALEEARQKGRVALANLTGAQKKELQDALLVVKKYDIDTNAKNALALEEARQEGYEKRNESAEKQTAMRVGADLLKNVNEYWRRMNFTDEQKKAYISDLQNMAFGNAGATAGTSGNAPATTPQEQVATPAAPAAPTATAVTPQSGKAASASVAYEPNAKYQPGDTVLRNGKTYSLGKDGKFHLKK